MVLTTQQIAQVAAAMQKAGLCPGSVNKAQFTAALVAEDAQIDSSAAALNSALPLPYRTAASTAQKAAMVGCLALRRAIESDPAVKAALRRLLA